MAIEFYADETGTDDPLGRSGGSKVVAVGGFLSWCDDWNKFCVEWQKVLSENEVGVFHLSELSDDAIAINPESPYRLWDRDKKEQFVLELAKIARTRTQFGVCSLTSLEGYNEVVPDWLKQYARNFYGFCALGFFQLVLDELKKWWHPRYSAETQVAFIFEQQPEFEFDTLRMFHQVQVEDYDRRMGTVRFAPKKESPLQAADLLVGRMRKAVERVLKIGQLIEDPGTWNASLGADGKDDRLIVKYHDEKSLRETVDQAERDRHRYRATQGVPRPRSERN